MINCQRKTLQCVFSYIMLELKTLSCHDANFVAASVAPVRAGVVCHDKLRCYRWQQTWYRVNSQFQYNPNMYAKITRISGIRITLMCAFEMTPNTYIWQLTCTHTKICNIWTQCWLQTKTHTQEPRETENVYQCEVLNELPPFHYFLRFVLFVYFSSYQNSGWPLGITFIYSNTNSTNLRHTFT